MIHYTEQCKKCGNIINLETDVFIREKKTKNFEIYHYDCFIEVKMNSKRPKYTLEKAKEKAEELKIENEKWVKELIAKNKLYRWLQNNYLLVSIPSYFTDKMEKIFTGTWKDLTEPIDPEDLLDMFKMKKSELDKNNNYRRSKGKGLEDIARVNYDLAILIQKYKSYKRWQESQLVVDQERKENLEKLKSKIDYNKVVPVSNKKNTFSISDILDEI